MLCHEFKFSAEKFNLNRRVLEDWLKIASRQFCCEFCSKGFAVRWRLTEHQKRLHFTKEEWAMSVEGRRQRQNVEKVKLDVMPSACPSPCPSPGQSPKRISDENEFELKEEVEESFF